MKTRIYLRASLLLLSIVCVACGKPETKETILVEAESFDHYGGWFIDTQFMDQMGSPYLIAHGFGKLVANASTTVNCTKSGNYRIWVRTYDWVGKWRGEEWPERKRALGEAPGRFSILINGKSIEGTYGTTGDDWHWRKGPIVALEEGPFELALEDLTGFDGRCDAILFSQDVAMDPPNCNPEMKRWRDQLLGLDTIPRDAGNYDLVVVGGGVAGMCASLQAARLGFRVALIQDRPVLGGNASSEICVNIHGQLGFEPYPNVGNIVREIQPEEERHWHKGPFETGLPEDIKRLNLIQAEENIDLFLNHRANGVEMDGLKISAVLADNTKTGETVRFNARLFADCTGDGCVGALAKADFAMTVYGHTGRTNLWFIHDLGTPTLFPHCPWALNLYGFEIPDPPTKVDGWYWESGFDHDPIDMGEYIRDWNLRAVYGAWDAVKNGKKEYGTHEIKWLAFISGKRESRRLLGDVILNEDDILGGREFEDGCVPLSWRLDMHQPDKDYLAEFERDAFIADAHLVGPVEKTLYEAPYWMPYRCLYSRDVPNLFMAGRNISTTQGALGAARVQRTTGMMGEIVGKAASICIENNVYPRAVYEIHLDELKTLMKK